MSTTTDPPHASHRRRNAAVAAFATALAVALSQLLSGGDVTVTANTSTPPAILSRLDSIERRIGSLETRARDDATLAGEVGQLRGAVETFIRMTPPNGEKP